MVMNRWRVQHAILAGPRNCTCGIGFIASRHGLMVGSQVACNALQSQGMILWMGGARSECKSSARTLTLKQEPRYVLGASCSICSYWPIKIS
eukprot:2375344-Amphidinium_carterae.1